MKPPLPVPAKADPGFTLEEMKAFVRRHFDDFVNRQQSDVALKNFSADFLDHDEPGGAVAGPLAAKTMMEHAYQRWPDLRVAVVDILAEGDKVMVRNIWTATEKATGKKNPVPRLRAVALCESQNRGTLGDPHAPGGNRGFGGARLVINFRFAFWPGGRFNIRT